MSYPKRFVCLANSRKQSGRCIAGLEIEGGQVGGWIRPVSSSPEGEISVYDQTMENGSNPTLLDILEIQMIETRPDGCQTENHLFDEGFYWEKVGEFQKPNLLHFCDAPSSLWINGHSSSNGINDRIPVRLANSLPNSLVLVEPKQLAIEVRQSQRGRKQVRAEFWVAGENYNLGVTDPLVERQYRSLGLGSYTYGQRAVACISIGEPFYGYCYKLVASIISL